MTTYYAMFVFRFFDPNIVPVFLEFFVENVDSHFVLNNELIIRFSRELNSEDEMLIWSKAQVDLDFVETADVVLLEISINTLF